MTALLSSCKGKCQNYFGLEALSPHSSVSHLQTRDCVAASCWLQRNSCSCSGKFCVVRIVLEIKITKPLLSQILQKHKVFVANVRNESFNHIIQIPSSITKIYGQESNIPGDFLDDLPPRSLRLKPDARGRSLGGRRGGRRGLGSPGSPGTEGELCLS